MFPSTQLRSHPKGGDRTSNFLMIVMVYEVLILREEAPSRWSVVIRTEHHGVVAACQGLANLARVASRAPTFRATAGSCEPLHGMTRAPAAAANSPVLSIEPSSTTMIS